jgi:hypothetical protein
MYLLKQWRESRIISWLAIASLLLLLAGVIKLNFLMGEMHAESKDPRDIAAALIAFLLVIFNVESFLVAFWGWLAAGIGVGKNLGEESGSFLFTRPRRRAWFLWHDWGFAMAQIAIIIVLTNLMFGFWIERGLVYLHTPGIINLGQDEPVSLLLLMLLISIGALLAAGLIYSLTYFCTILIKRTSGVMLGAGILVGYLIFRGIIQHYYPSVHLPDLIMDVFRFDHHTFAGISDHLLLAFVVRGVVVLLFPLAAQVILERSEI